MGNYNTHYSALDAFPQIASFGYITPFYGGSSGARHFVMAKDGESFFVKISQSDDSKKALLNELSSYGYSCPICVSEYIADGKTCRVYKFIGGQNLEVVNTGRYGLIASQIVDNLKILESINVKSLLGVSEISITQKLAECLSEIDVYFRCFPSSLPFSSYEFKQRATEYAGSFNGVERHLIHGDIKIDNFILGEDKLFILDDGDLSIGPFAFNFQYSVHQLYLRDEKSGLLLKAIINNYFQGDVPKSFHNNLKFILIKKFFNRYKDKDPEKKEEFRVLFEHIFRDIFSNEYISELL